MNRKIPQMQPQFKDTVERKTFANLKELVQVVDDHLELVCRRLEYVSLRSPVISSRLTLYS